MFLVVAALASASEADAPFDPDAFDPDAFDPDAPFAPPPPLRGRAVERQLTLDADGRVLDASGRRMTTRQLAERIGDDDTVRAYRTRRATSTVGFTTLTVVGGLAFTGGVLFDVGGGALVLAAGGDPFDNPAFLHGALVAAGGGALASAGIYGIVVGRRQADDPRTWYRPETLRRVVDTWNAGDDPRDLLGAVTIGVSVGPGTLAVHGAF